MDKPKISVIMGIYNCAETLPKALDSLLAQTCQNFKVILCDDGSADNTFAIAQEYVNRYPQKILLIKNDINRGLNYTLNHCLKYVDTEYVARMDGDDISLPERFAKELYFLEENPEFAAVSTPMIYFDDNGEFRRGRGGKVIVAKDFLSGPPIPHAPCMVRKRIFDLVDGYTVDDKLLRVEDYHLWFKIFSKGENLYLLEEPLYAMRDDRNAFARRKFKYRLNSARLRLKWYPKIGLPWWSVFYALLPVMIGLMPNFIYKSLHKNNQQNKSIS